MIYISLCVWQSLKISQTHKNTNQPTENIPLDPDELCNRNLEGFVFFLKTKMPHFVVHKHPKATINMVQVSRLMH